MNISSGQLLVKDSVTIPLIASGASGPGKHVPHLGVPDAGVTIDLSAANWWTIDNPTIGRESLIVKHTENGKAAAVSFVNDGGHFVQRFVFGSNSGLPQGEGASLWASWNGLVIAWHQNLSFVISSVGDAPQMQITPDAVEVGGNLQVSGDITATGDVLLANADCADEFDVMDDEPSEPGTVMVIDQLGKLQRSQDAYDKRAAGVISGAGEFRAAITLDKRSSSAKRVAVALVGKVYCKVDAQYSPIEVGDLLTTSSTSGHALKAADSVKAFGAVIGKALGSLQSGQGLIPMLVALQ